MYTPEQQAIIDSTAPRIRVLAFAGTGKTSTLVGYARARPDQKMLYAAYNKSIQLEAQKKFPPNVSCRTIHSIAFGVHGKPYAHKLGNMRVGDVAERLRLAFPQAAQVLATVNNYLYSADDRISAAHLPPESNRNNQLEVFHVLEGAQALWQAMQDHDDKHTPMPHDGYLKLYALSRPTIPTGHLLFDEAQDANPVTSAILLAHAGPICVVGDSHQSIYGWRGARDALADLPNAKTYALTKSFRFGKGVARVANHLLEHLGEHRILIGGGQYQDTRMQVDRDRPYALIARTNMCLIQAAIAALPKKLRSFYVGGVENAKLGLIQDGYHLFRGQRESVQDRFVKKFSSLSALADYASQANDIEMSLLVRIVLTYTHQIPRLLQEIRASAVDAIADAQRIYTTAHRAKGLEFDQVLLADDYADLCADNQVIPLARLDRQEVNLHYVAATRAIEALEVSPQLREFIQLRERGRSPGAVVRSGPGPQAATGAR